jgi:Tol biopolymer transport system component
MRTTVILPYAVFLLTLVACSGSDVTAPTEGSIQVTVATTGNAGDFDADGYTVAVDGGVGEALPINGSVTFSQLTVADHSVALSGLASNCTVSGQDPLPVTVTAGATSQASFQVSCAPPAVQPGDLQVTVATSGSPADLDQDGFAVSLDRGAYQALAINGSITFPQLTPGTHSVALAGIASNCAVSGENPATATVVAGTTAHADFQIVCAAVGGLTGRIAFVSTRDGDPEIYVMNADGTGITRLTNSLGNDVSPAWSPDGTRIAFRSDRDGGNEEIYVMNADGTSVTRLTNDGNFDEEPAWSPDGKRIAFQSNRAGHFEIYVMKADGSGVTRLTRDLPTLCQRGVSVCRAELSPAWSPDGGRIAFSHWANIFSHVLDVMDADGKNVTQLGFVGVGGISWSVNDKIAFNRGGLTIAVVNPDGSDLTDLTDNQVAHEDPAWSPDGSMLSFVSDRDGNLELYAMNADGTGVRRLTYDAADDSEPAWGP